MMTIDPNLRGDMLEDEWNSEEVQNEMMFTGITHEEWLEHRINDDDNQEEEHDDFVWQSRQKSHGIPASGFSHHKFWFTGGWACVTA